MIDAKEVREDVRRGVDELDRTGVRKARGVVLAERSPANTAPLLPANDPDPTGRCVDKSLVFDRHKAEVLGVDRAVIGE